MTKLDIIDEALNYYFPDPKCELIYNKDYELVLAVMLSAQCTDKRVNMVTSELFKKYDSLEKLNSLSINDIEREIKSIGMYHNKARNFKGIVEGIINYGGVVPNDREKLESLPGIGRKTTNVVLSLLFNEPCIAVDTHVDRVSKRLGLASYSDDVLKVEKKLMKFFPKDEWNKVHYQIVLFGRYKCIARNPLCEACKLKSICKEKTYD